MWSVFIQVFVAGSERCMFYAMECVMAVQGHPRSLILVPIESSIATSYWSSIVIFVLSCPVSEILQVFCWEQRPHLYSTRIFGVLSWTRLPVLGLQGDPKLINRVNNFELAQLISSRYINVTDRPPDLRPPLNSRRQFRSKLKTHLFRQAYNTAWFLWEQFVEECNSVTVTVTVTDG